jgi:formylglycine-generating enzyme required for sulfatase activity
MTLLVFRALSRCSIPALFAALLICCDTASAITIDTVPVGDVGNPKDPESGNLYGGVNYAYSIGKYEVTVAQYTEFLNAVAATDTYDLYSTAMETDLNVAGIARSGAAGGYTYSVIGSPNHPITYVSWGDAARFANWLHNGQPTGAQSAATTERGAYALNGANTDAALMAVSRNAGAKWFIASENEWYKAAYYQPAAQGGDVDSYWDYPMRTNTMPYSDQPPGDVPDVTRVGNFNSNDGPPPGYNRGYAVTGSIVFDNTQNYLTDVGAYSSSPSYYGTFDQGGNALEWQESVFSALNGTFRGLRGGGWYGHSNVLRGPYRNFAGGPTGQNNEVGFRVAMMAIPEPSTALLATMVCSLLMPSVRRRR